MEDAAPPSRSVHEALAALRRQVADLQAAQEVAAHCTRWGHFPRDISLHLTGGHGNVAADAQRDPDQHDSGTPADPARAATGIEGLDVVLGGGLPRGRVYVIEGSAGTGKTTLALHFLLAGRAHNEPCLLVTTIETRDDLSAAAHSHGWSLAGLEVLELSLTDPLAQPAQRQTLFRPAQVELDETMQAVLAELERVHPARVVLDSVSMLRAMADEPFAYRRYMVSLKNALVARGCTALITDEVLAPQDLHLRTLAHGVVHLLREVTPFGNEQRQVEIVKMRGMPFRSGRHDMVIATGGLRVFPRFVAASLDVDAPGAWQPTSVAQLDVLLGGGLDRGTTTLLVGAAGTGKSSVAMQCVVAALQHGQAAAVYLFDERPPTWFHRAEGLGFPLRQQVAQGQLLVEQIDPSEMRPGQFAHALQDAITHRGVRLVVIDSLTGYVHAMPEERFLTLHLHEVLTWLGQHGVTTLLVLEQHGLFESTLRSALDLSYLADTVVLFRYFEYQGAMHRALSVVKRRSGPHEHTIRELTLGPHGIVVGEPLRQFRGVLTGLPLYEGDPPWSTLRRAYPPRPQTGGRSRWCSSCPPGGMRPWRSRVCTRPACGRTAATTWRRFAPPSRGPRPASWPKKRCPRRPSTCSSRRCSGNRSGPTCPCCS
jgi:circadian clock protein KaiC